MELTTTLPRTLSPAILVGVREAASAGFVFAIVTATGLAQGGYFPESWGWAALGCLLVAFSFLVLGAEVRLSRLEWTFVVSLLLLLAWTAASTAWTLSAGRTVQDAQRTALYVSAVLAVLIVARGSAHAIAVGVSAAATCVSGYALATRLLPDVLGYDGEGLYRLARPLGYWNGVAVLAAVGALLSAGLVAQGRHRLVRAGAAASLPVLLVTLSFTFSRGGWLALALGLAVWISLDPRRRTAARSLAAPVLVSAAAVALASRAPALVDGGHPLDRAVREGHGFALALPLLAAAAGFIVYERDAAPPARAERRRRAGAALVVLVAIGAAALLAFRGGDGGTVQPAAGPAPAPQPAPPAQPHVSLLSTSSHSRTDYWRVASREYLDHPVLGSGAGTFELFWNRERPDPVGSRFAHNLYLQALAELGPAALVLLLVALAAPFAALRSARVLPLVPAAAGAYAAVVAHAALDWDWQLPAVMLAGLFAGAAILVAAREAAPPPPLSGRMRAAVLSLVIVLAVLVGTAWAGNHALSLASGALARGDYRAAAGHADTARRWQPWASEPLLNLGLAQIGLGDDVAARASFRRAVAKDPDDWQAWSDLAAAARGAERAAAVREARRLNPLGEAEG